MTKDLKGIKNNAENVANLFSDLAADLQLEASVISHGIVTLEVHVRDTKPVRVNIARSRSIKLEDYCI